jgi:hypothetical protein
MKRLLLPVLVIVLVLGIAGAAVAKPQPKVNGSFLVGEGYMEFQAKGTLDAATGFLHMEGINAYGDYVIFHWDVTRLAVLDEERAAFYSILAWTVPDLTSSGYIPGGTFMAWRVMDNGEGARSAPDLFTMVWSNSPFDEVAYLTDWTTWFLPQIEVTTGNIQVH